MPRVTIEFNSGDDIIHHYTLLAMYSHPTIKGYGRDASMICLLVKQDIGNYKHTSHLMCASRITIISHRRNAVANAS